MENIINFLESITIPLIIILLLIIIFVSSYIGIIRVKDWIDGQKSQIQTLTMRWQSEKLEKKALEKELVILEDKLEDLKSNEIINLKRKNFLKIPNIAFHYADKKQIESFYNDYFKEPTFASLVTEITGEVDQQIGGGIPKMLESKIGGKDISKWISTIKMPDLSLNGAFLRYQRETIKSGQVTLGLEEVEIELTELQEFDESVNMIVQRYDFKIPQDLLDNKRIILKQKAAEKTIRKLEVATGWVLIEGRFRIEDHKDFYKCVYSHPVNEYLIHQTTDVIISVPVQKTSLEPNVVSHYKASINQVIPLKVYAQVWQPVDRQNESWELKLTPLAIYQ
ncbi:MAG: hypothetical protein DYG86_13535 [Chloroflexi bacterium CFX2]|nr:hypothetical protein [Chloroflexi bacterium CFX2]